MFVRMFARLRAGLRIAGLALLFTAAAAAVGADVATFTAHTVSAFVDHTAHAAGGGAFLAVVAAPLPATVPFAVGINEACRLMGISRALIYQLINAGELAVVKIGTRTVIRTDVIQRFLAANTGVPDPNLSPLKRAERKAAASIAPPPPSSDRTTSPVSDTAAPAL
jgi:excisionase family DNA binding protein